MSKIAPYRALQQNIVSRQARVLGACPGADVQRRQVIAPDAGQPRCVALEQTSARGYGCAMSSELAATVYFDLICPWCLIGKRNLETALTMLAQSDPHVTVKVDWRSTQLLPHVPEDGLDFTAFYEARLGGAAAVRARQAQVLAAAREAGCEIAFERILRMPNTAKAHRLLHFARSAGPGRFEQLLDRLFQALKSPVRKSAGATL